MLSTAKNNDLRDRTKKFALRIIRLYASLPSRGEGQVLGHQALRSGTSVGAQYREACRARSTAEFISKMMGALQELDETVYWLELLVEGKIVTAAKLAELKNEAEELVAIFAASVLTSKRKQ